MTAADLVLFVHFVIAAYIVGGFLFLALGQLAGWHWTRRPGFRYSHLAAIAIVAFIAVLGLPCPLTIVEDTLRHRGPGTSFVAYWVSRLLYLDLPNWVFTTVYVVLALAALGALRWAPLERRHAAQSSLT